MTIQTYTPSAGLAPFIDRYVVIECSEEVSNRVFPGTSLVVAFRYKGHVSYTANGVKNVLTPSVVTGMRKSARLINYLDGSGNVLVKFKEAGARAFIKEPLHELFEDSISLMHLTGYSDTSFIEERLADASCNYQRINLIESFLTSKLHHEQGDPLIMTALAHMRAAGGRVRIRLLAASLNISLDPFEKRFRRVVGVSPKQFSYLIKMQSVVRSRLKEKSLAEVAIDAGYFDQAHFNKDFRLYTGQTPTEFAKAPVYW
ncbi:Transcriptional regulator, AraC family [Fulvivirga imtechensis AK7]|uniref:Transcriptional regulator, AraC family n=1 Tax=Fulvivirga imtechensis AK7 TaxID=1237149 RepID=L8JWN3_9BACT|nr:helix-turn-helix domain-containing protein [Fulvivirga imtechensis]ELR71622.1 Transcriptional regulator, AraC family [Fulvivirga imtechensis AK7]